MVNISGSPKDFHRRWGTVFNNANESNIIVLTYDGTIKLVNYWEDLLSPLISDVCSFMNCPIANIVKMFLEYDDRTHMMVNTNGALSVVSVSFVSRFFAMMFYIRERIGDSLLNFPNLDGQLIMTGDDSSPVVVVRLTEDDIESALKIIQYHDY